MGRRKRSRDQQDPAYADDQAIAPASCAAHAKYNTRSKSAKTRSAEPHDSAEPWDSAGPHDCAEATGAQLQHRKKSTPHRAYLQQPKPEQQSGHLLFQPNFHQIDTSGLALPNGASFENVISVMSNPKSYDEQHIAATTPAEQHSRPELASQSPQDLQTQPDPDLHDQVMPSDAQLDIMQRHRAEVAPSDQQQPDDQVATPSAVDATEEARHDSPVTHEDSPPATAQEPSQPADELIQSPTPPPQPSQELAAQALPQLLLHLDSKHAPPKSWPLTRHQPGLATLQYWQKNHTKPNMFSMMLIGDAQQPGKSVGMSVEDLRIHSLWYSATDARGNSAVVLPLQMPADIVYEMVQSLQSGQLLLRHDTVEPILLQAHAMKMPLVETACKEYLLSLQLRCSQLSRLIQLFDRLDYTDALRRTLLKLCNKIWIPKTAKVIAGVVKHLLQSGDEKVELIRTVLQSDSSGKLCQLQVLDVLQQADMTQADRLLPAIFMVGKVSDRLLRNVEKAIRRDEASAKLLRDVIARQGFTSWSSAGSSAREAVSVVSPTATCQLAKLTVQFPVVKGVSFEVAFPLADAKRALVKHFTMFHAHTAGDADGNRKYKLKLLSAPSRLSHSKIEHVVLYFVSYPLPGVHAICKWKVSTACSPWTALPCKSTQTSALTLGDACIGLSAH